MPKWTIYEKILHHKVEIHTLTTKTLIIHLIVNQSSVQLILHSSNKGVFIIVFLASNVKFHADAGKQFVSAYPFRYDLMTPMRGTEGQKKNY